MQTETLGNSNNSNGERRVAADNQKQQLHRENETFYSLRKVEQGVQCRQKDEKFSQLSDGISRVRTVEMGYTKFILVMEVVQLKNTCDLCGPNSTKWRVVLAIELKTFHELSKKPFRIAYE